MIALFGVVAWCAWKGLFPTPTSIPAPAPAPAPNAESRSKSRILISWRSAAFAFVIPAAGDFSLRALRQNRALGLGQHQAHHLGLFHLPALFVARPDPEVALAGAGGNLLYTFASGFVSLIGGMAVGTPGFDIANRTELEAVATVVRKIPIKERFAAFPTYNHPLLMDGRKVVLGYRRPSLDPGFRLRADRATTQHAHARSRRIGGNARGRCMRAISFGARRKNAPTPQARSRGAGRRRSSAGPLGHNLRSRAGRPARRAINCGRSPAALRAIQNHLMQRCTFAPRKRRPRAD